LGKTWVEKGRALRINILDHELIEMRTKVAVASAKTHIKEQVKNFKWIERNIKEIETMSEEIRKVKSEITHLKSQIRRVDKKKKELSHETESEGRKR
jgi:coiled-coil domain-containing protein 63/114